METSLEASFFNQSAVVVARELLGKFLVLHDEKQTRRFMITETEAYEGPKDRASHAFRGRTPRTEVMFGEAGVWYVYFIYGMYYMLNIVTGEAGHPAAVLIRSVAGITGPGRLTKSLRIDKKFNTKKATPETGLWIEDGGVIVSEEKVLVTPRIGVSYAGPEWSAKPYRFVLKQDS